MELSLSTKSRSEIQDVTRQVQQACRKWGKTGFVHLFCPHTTAGVALNENYDPTVKEDILDWVDGAVPRSEAYAHKEGNADAHIKSALVGSTLLLPVRRGTMLLGRWQGIYFTEFDGPRQRTLRISFLPGEE
jgi:secondary thiamine-phosphate synthase enzyme